MQYIYKGLETTNQNSMANLIIHLLDLTSASASFVSDAEAESYEKLLPLPTATGAAIRGAAISAVSLIQIAMASEDWESLLVDDEWPGPQTTFGRSHELIPQGHGSHSAAYLGVHGCANAANRHGATVRGDLSEDVIYREAIIGPHWRAFNEGFWRVLYSLSFLFYPTAIGRLITSWRS